ncbi:MAG: rhodanese-like domain-containing protein [Magnetococcales bacterium]|nr:rhodanese-like domain-containing protein [Magnetococcales bacterium]
MTQSACPHSEIQGTSPRPPEQAHGPAHPDLHQILPDEAFALLQNKEVVFIDIRSTTEHFYVGNPKGAILVPWQDPPDAEVNPHFVEEVSYIAQKGQPVLLICRSGQRSIDAGNALIEAGFQPVYHVLEGFEGDRDEDQHRNSINGWRVRGLPWTQC